jgi:23S rRNA (cytosine1962-C5)-methyltransferase
VTIELIDAGDGRRLEQFGERVVDRPHPGATGPRRQRSGWTEADLRFDRGPGWSGRADPDATWDVTVAGLRLELRATESGGIGIFPEQMLNAAWLKAQVERRAAGGSRPEVLNLFAHTGLLTLLAAKAGASVAHVDASRPAAAWARRNAELSGLADRPIRWLVDNATAFVGREVRRGHLYDGIVLDPPAYGHAGRRAWRLDDDLPALLEASANIARPGAFLLLTAHTEGLDPDRLSAVVRAAAPRAWRALEVVPLDLTAGSGARLSLGTAVRSRA